MKRIIVFLMIFVGTTLFAPTITLAQGTHDCRWGSLAGGPPSCHVENISCDSGYEPYYTHCSQFTPSGDEVGCNAQVGIECVVKGTGTTGGVGPDIVDCPEEGRGIQTAIGCIPIEDTNTFIRFLLKWGMGVGGGVAFLLIILAGFQIITSTGDPKRLQAGKELLTSAIAGLLLIIFSVFILRLIGADILGIFQ